MTKWLSRSLVIISLLAISNSGSFSQQKPSMAKLASASTGKDYVSIKLGSGVWHIEDTVHETYRDSMYLVEVRRENSADNALITIVTAKNL
jgi:hypothetical protein